MAGNTELQHARIKILPDIPIPQKNRRSFNSAVKILATDAKVPVALIMRLDRDRIEVFSTNAHSDNPYIVGSSENIPMGLYCETVVKTGDSLIIPNATKDNIWQDNPDIKLDMIAYMGLPIYWPTGEVFGTVCVLNSKEHHFSEMELGFITAVHDAIENDLLNIYRQYCIKFKDIPQAVEIAVASRL